MWGNVCNFEVMNQTLHLMPLRLTPYSDTKAILSAYSRESGTMAFAVPMKRRGMFHPLAVLEVEASVKPGRDVHTFKEARPLLVLHTVMMDPVRSALTMFLAEALQVILRQSEGDALVFDFVADAMARLNDERTPVGNFHLAFLIRLAAILGIAPDCGEYRPGRVFDMVDACFRASAPLHGQALDPLESTAAYRLSRITWENMGRYRFTRPQRAAALRRILEYYSLHYANLMALKSPSVLEALMG